MSGDADNGSIDRRSVLKNVAVGAAGVSGLVVAGAESAEAAELAGQIRTQGDLDPVRAAERLLDVEGHVTPSDDCYTETKCYSGCSGYGKLAYRECCPGIAGCGECCNSWTYTDNCC
ncbi:hypothetical protein BRC81_02455 [Halobacteriales archaeon QS_1_68_20]|nr:MAG: hypothetical protein BRC81_02455 [Halobacteriales archaeon QS_1_68_20]